MNMLSVIRPAIFLTVGLLLGAFSMYQYLDKQGMINEIQVRKDDNEQSKKIAKVTISQKVDSTVKTTVIRHTIRPAKKCKELTDVEINSMCTGRYIPDDILRDIRGQIDRARGRLN